MANRAISLGCRLNQYESEKITHMLDAQGYRNVTVVNSCGVTNEAMKQSRRAVRRAVHQYSAGPVFVTGCASDIEPEIFQALAGRGNVIANAHKFTQKSYASLPDCNAADPATSQSEIKEHCGGSAQRYRKRIRANVMVQNGCDHQCTFCIIPTGRGKSRSMLRSAIVKEIQALVDGGTCEVTLTGVDITAYGQDFSPRESLGLLVQHILRKVPNLARLRLSSLDCVEIDSFLLEALAGEERLMPHLHLSLQSGDDLTLKRMRRRHLACHAAELIAACRAKRPDIVFGADIIAGFPTETDDMFNRSIRFLREMDISFLHVFPFSPRKGTPAARMPQLPGDVIKSRAQTLRNLGAELHQKLIERESGKIRNVVLEHRDTARTEHYLPVCVAPELKHDHSAGSMVTARLQKDVNLPQGMIAAPIPGYQAHVS